MEATEHGMKKLGLGYLVEGEVVVVLQLVKLAQPLGLLLA